ISAPRSLRADARGPQRRRDPRLPRRPLRRVRALPPALRRPHLAAVAGPGAGAPGRRHRGGEDRAQPQPPAAAGRGGPGMVSPAVLYAVIVLAAALLAAAVAWPLRRRSPRLFVAVLVALPVMAFALYRIVGTPQALEPGAVAVAGEDVPSMDEAVAQLEAALERDPAQPEGWRLLARAHAALGNRERAR